MLLGYNTNKYEGNRLIINMLHVLEKADTQSIF